MSRLTKTTCAQGAVLVALALLTLTACGGEDAPDPGSDAGASILPTETLDDTGSDAGDIGATFPGTGEYAIGTDIPFGGFQLLGEPVGQPDGCTWSIVDADGAVAFENQGTYVWLTDIPEAVTFVTDGCPDWEQFE